MKMIDVTNSYPKLVTKQLENTDATFVKIYTLGKTTVVYTEAPKHREIVLFNKSRNVKQNEINTVLSNLVDKNMTEENMNIIKAKGLVEISIPVIEIAGT